MVIHDGTEEQLFEACRMIAARPNPDHLEEDKIIHGRARDIRDALAEAVRESGFAAFAILDGEAVAGGVIDLPAEGIFLHRIWFVSTAGAPGIPFWMPLEGRRMLRAADAFLKWPRGYVQEIPESYRAGIKYALWMGFEAAGTYRNKSGRIVSKMTRMVPKWV